MREASKISLPELKQIELDAMTRFAQVCQDHGLRYCLAGGTLLGAVRHKGFIPWDDDVDILMPRPDYMKFVEIATSALGPEYTFRTHYSDRQYPYPFGKITDNRTVLNELKFVGGTLGVYIDIFPVDGLPADRKASQRHFSQLRFYHKLRLFGTLKNRRGRTPLRSLVKRSVIALSRLFGTAFWVNRIDRLARRYDYEGAEFIAAAVSGNYGEKKRFEKACMDRFIKVEFEGRQFNAPAGYDRYLGNLYGDYMQLPPEDKRVVPHLFDAYWRI